MERRRASRGADGFTLIELMATMVLFGILVALAVPAWSGYRARQQHVGSARELVGELRHVQVKAQTEETTYRAAFAANGTSVTLERLTPGTTTWTTYEVLKPSSTAVTYVSPSFVQPDGSTSGVCYFYARGAATKGTVLVRRSGSSKTYTVSVEGLTARVSYS